MGINNRSRREQKQRQKQRKSSKALQSPAQSQIDIEVESLCEIVAVSLIRGELPPPSIMKPFEASRNNPRLGDLSTLLVGFLNYLFMGDASCGSLEALEKYGKTIKRTSDQWLYPTLQLYCLLSHPQIEQNDCSPIAAFIEEHNKTHSMTQLLAPLNLVLGIMDGGNKSKTSLHTVLLSWLGYKHFYNLTRPFQKFLELKRPQPKLKTVEAFEKSLRQIQLDKMPQWRDAISQVIQLSVMHKVGTEINTKAWEMSPQINELLELMTDPEPPQASVGQTIDMASANSTLLYQIERQVNKQSLSYSERVEYEFVICRILANISDDPQSKLELESHLDLLFSMVCTGVSEADQALADNCLNILLEWLCVSLCNYRISLSSNRSLRHPYRKHPEDYRVALLHFLFAQNSSKRAENLLPQYRHVNPAIFFFALESACSQDLLFKQFYWPLSGESQKMLMSYVCRELLVNTRAENVESLWRKLQKNLFDFSQEPLLSVVKGNPCEAEWLFFSALAAMGHPKSNYSWLKPEHIEPLLRSAHNLLKQGGNFFAQKLICTLLQTMCSLNMTSLLLQAIVPLTEVANNIAPHPDLIPCLTYLLKALQLQKDKMDSRYDNFYALCKGYAALRPLILKPAPKVKQKHGQIGRDLFGDS